MSELPAVGDVWSLGFLAAGAAIVLFYLKVWALLGNEEAADVLRELNADYEREQREGGERG